MNGPSCQLHKRPFGQFHSPSFFQGLFWKLVISMVGRGPPLFRLFSSSKSLFWRDKHPLLPPFWGYFDSDKKPFTTQDMQICWPLGLSARSRTLISSLWNAHLPSVLISWLHCTPLGTLTTFWAYHNYPSIVCSRSTCSSLFLTTYTKDRLKSIPNPNCVKAQPFFDFFW